MASKCFQYPDVFCDCSTAFCCPL